MNWSNTSPRGYNKQGATIRKALAISLCLTAWAAVGRAQEATDRDDREARTQPTTRPAKGK